MSYILVTISLILSKLLFFPQAPWAIVIVPIVVVVLLIVIGSIVAKAIDNIEPN
jgi:hypothetical protein